MLQKGCDVEHFCSRFLSDMPTVIESKLKTLRIIQVNDLTNENILFLRKQKEVLSIAEEKVVNSKMMQFDDMIKEGMESGPSVPWDKEEFIKRMAEKSGDKE